MDRAIKILFLAANPKDTGQLRLDEEMRGIDQALRQAEFRDKFDIKQQWAVRVIDLQSHLLRYQPDIVHFSGHGSATSEIILEDTSGNSQPVSSRALSQLFFVLKDNIRCVILNACYSEQQAQAIAKHIDCVIGMSKAIGDSAAINFAIAFYQALGYGRDVKTAFDLGCVQIDLENLSEQDTPKLLSFNTNPKEIALVHEPLVSSNYLKLDTETPVINSGTTPKKWRAEIMSKSLWKRSLRIHLTQETHLIEYEQTWGSNNLKLDGKIVSKASLFEDDKQEFSFIVKDGITPHEARITVINRPWGLKDFCMTISDHLVYSE